MLILNTFCFFLLENVDDPPDRFFFHSFQTPCVNNSYSISEQFKLSGVSICAIPLSCKLDHTLFLRKALNVAFLLLIALALSNIIRINGSWGILFHPCIIKVLKNELQNKSNNYSQIIFKYKH